MPTSTIDWQEEQLIVTLGGQQTLDDIGKPAVTKRLLGFGHEKDGMVTMKFADSFELIPKAEFIEIEKQWNLLQNYQLTHQDPNSKSYRRKKE